LDQLLPLVPVHLGVDLQHRIAAAPSEHLGERRGSEDPPHLYARRLRPGGQPLHLPRHGPLGGHPAVLRIGVPRDPRPRRVAVHGPRASIYTRSTPFSSTTASPARVRRTSSPSGSPGALPAPAATPPTGSGPAFSSTSCSPSPATAEIAWLITPSRSWLTWA